MNTWVEKRQTVRQTVRIDGVAVTNNGLVRIPLTVVNLSRAGAMVELSDECELPEEMVLLFDHTAEPARKIWQVDRIAGVQFIDVPGGQLA